MNRLRTLRADLPAGVTAAAVVIPQAMAYATIAGLPVQAGLYTAIVPLFVYSLVGTSRPLSVSTTSTIAALTAAALAAADVETDGDAIRAVATLAVLTGSSSSRPGPSSWASSPTSSPCPCWRGSRRAPGC